jgi:hypothetical protein
VDWGQRLSAQGGITSRRYCSLDCHGADDAARGCRNRPLSRRVHHGFFIGTGLPFMIAVIFAIITMISTRSHSPRHPEVHRTSSCRRCGQGDYIACVLTTKESPHVAACAPI